SWDAIEAESARSWITRWCGREVYERMWRSLFEYKFYRYADDISAAWIWARIRRLGRSRRSLFKEELGYIEGGSQTLVNALVESIQLAGGRVHTSCPTEQVLTEGGRVIGVRTPAGRFAGDAVICTIPTPRVSKLVTDLPNDWKAR